MSSSPPSLAEMPIAEQTHLHEDATFLRNEQLRCLEAYIFANPEPVPISRLQELLPSSSDVESMLEELRGFYCNRGIQLVKRGNAWAFRTDPALAESLIQHRKQKRRLSRQALETLAIIAYKQPITRPEIEVLRGVSVSRGILSTLLEHRWIMPGARRKIPGRPLTWKTTTAFLDHFGLASLDSLPGASDLPQEKEEQRSDDGSENRFLALENPNSSEQS